MKFINYLQNIAGISIYPLISLLLFVAFFIVITWWVMKTDDARIDEMKQLPLENDSVK